MEIPRNPKFARIHYIDNIILEKYAPDIDPECCYLDVGIVNKILNDRSLYVKNLLKHGDIVKVGRFSYRNEMTGIYHQNLGVIGLANNIDDNGTVPKLPEFSDIYFHPDYWKFALFGSYFWLDTDFKNLEIENIHPIVPQKLDVQQDEIIEQNINYNDSELDDIIDHPFKALIKDSEWAVLKKDDKRKSKGRGNKSTSLAPVRK